MYNIHYVYISLEEHKDDTLDPGTYYKFFSKHMENFNIILSHDLAKKYFRRMANFC